MSNRFKPGPRAQAVTVLTLVAAVGALLGIVGDRLLAQQRDAGLEPPATAQQAPFRGGDVGVSDSPGAGPRARGVQRPMGMPGAALRDMRYAAQLAQLIELSPAQQVAIDSIVAEERRRVRELTRELEPRFREITQRTRRRVEAVLTPEQVEQLQLLRQQRTRMLREQPPGQRPPGLRQRRAVPPADSLS